MMTSLPFKQQPFVSIADDEALARRLQDEEQQAAAHAVVPLPQRQFYREQQQQQQQKQIDPRLVAFQQNSQAYHQPPPHRIYLANSAPVPSFHNEKSSSTERNSEFAREMAQFGSERTSRTATITDMAQKSNTQPARFQQQYHQSGQQQQQHHHHPSPRHQRQYIPPRCKSMNSSSEVFSGERRVPFSEGGSDYMSKNKDSMVGGSSNTNNGAYIVKSAPVSGTFSPETSLSSLNNSMGRLNESNSSSVEFGLTTPAAVAESLEYARRLQEKAFSKISANPSPPSATVTPSLTAETDCSDDFTVALRLHEEEIRNIGTSATTAATAASAASAASAATAATAASAASAAVSTSDEESLGDSAEMTLKKFQEYKFKSSQRMDDEKLARYMQLTGTSIRDLSQKQVNFVLSGSQACVSASVAPEVTERSSFISVAPTSVIESTVTTTTTPSEILPAHSPLKTKHNSFEELRHLHSSVQNLEMEISPTRSIIAPTRNYPASAPTTRRFLGTSDAGLLTGMSPLDCFSDRDLIPPKPLDGGEEKKRGRRIRFFSADQRPPLLRNSKSGPVPKGVAPPTEASLLPSLPFQSPKVKKKGRLPSFRPAAATSVSHQRSTSNDFLTSNLDFSPKVSKTSRLLTIKKRGQAPDSPNESQRIQTPPRVLKPKSPRVSSSSRSNMAKRGAIIAAIAPIPAPPLMQQPIASANGMRHDSVSGIVTVCDLCKTSGGNMIAALNRKYHLECFRCQSCNVRIDPSEPFAFSQNNAGEKHPYHRKCFSELFDIHCVVCKQAIPTNSDGTISFVKHAFFDDEYMCVKHAESKTPRCTGCHRFESENEPFVDLNDAGRRVCFSCCRTVIVDNAGVKDLWLSVLSLFDNLNLPIWEGLWEIPILAVQSEAFNVLLKANKHPHHGATQIMAQGMCLTNHDQCRRFKLSSMRFEQKSSTFETVDGNSKGYTYFELPNKMSASKQDSEVYAILCMSGLPRDLTTGILAHEAMHAWFRLHPAYNDSTPLPDRVEEGCAQLMAMLLLRDGLDPPETFIGDKMEGPSDEKLRQYFMFSIEKDESDMFGKSYRQAFEAFESMGIVALLSHVVRHRDFPVI